MTAAVPAPAVAALLQAAIGHLTVPACDRLDAPALAEVSHDVCRDFRGILAAGCDRAAVAVFTAHLAGRPVPVLPEGHGENHIGNAGQVVWEPGDCITCHGHVSGGGVFTPAVTP